MPGLGRLQPGSQVFQSSGEATPAARLPTKFISNPPPASPVSGHLSPPEAPAGYAGGTPHLLSGGVVRQERTIGMRYLYSTGHTRQAPRRQGADGPPLPFTSGFQLYLNGPIHNGGFNDELYQAGYPGFNLGTSFKVPTHKPPGGEAVRPTRGVRRMTNITQKLTRVRRATGQPGNT